MLSSVKPTLEPTPTPTPTPPAELDTITGVLDSFVVSASRDPDEDGKLDWRVTLPIGTDVEQAIALLPGLTIPYAWIAAAEQPSDLPDGLDLVGTSSFTASVSSTFDSGESSTVAHSSTGVSLAELSFSAQLNGSVPDGVTQDQLFPLSLVIERTSPGSVRAVGSRDDVQVSLSLDYAPTDVQFPLLNLTLDATDTETSVNPLDGSTIVTFSTRSRIEALPVETLAGTVQGRLDDGSELSSARITAYVDQQRDGQLNWEIADLPGMDEVDQYRPLLPAIALSASWLTAEESPERLMDGREATGDGSFTATVRMDFPQGETLILKSTSTGLSPEEPDTAAFDVVVSGRYPSEEELAIPQSISTTIRRTDIGVLYGQQSLDDGVNVSLTITYVPLSSDAVPDSLLLLQVSPAIVDASGTIKFTSTSQLMLAQLPTVTAPTATVSVVTTLEPTLTPTPTPPAELDTITGVLDSFVVSASRDPDEDGKLDWRVTLPIGTDVEQAIALLPGLTIPYAWIAAAEQPSDLPDGLDLVGTSSFTASVSSTFDSGESSTVAHSSTGVSLAELSFSAQLNGSVPDGVTQDQLFPLSLVIERTSPGSVRAVGSRDDVQVSLSLDYAPTDVQFPLLNLTLDATDTETSVNPLDGSTIVTFSTRSRIEALPVETLAGTVQGRLDDGSELSSARITAYVDQQRDGQLNWEIADLPGMDEVDQYRPLLPAIALSASWLTAEESPERLMDGREATGDGSFTATVRMDFPQGKTLILKSTSTGLSPEEPDTAAFDVVVSGSYPSEEELAIPQSISTTIRQTDVGVLSGQQSLDDGVNVSLTITYVPLSSDAVRDSLLLLQVSPAVVDASGTIKFTSTSQLMLAQGECSKH